MPGLRQSIVAQLCYRTDPQLNLAHLVSDLERACRRCGEVAPVVRWDCDDIAFIDKGPARILVGLTEGPNADSDTCLFVSMGPAPTAGETEARWVTRRADSLCRLLADRINRRFPASDVLFHTVPAVIEADQIDQILNDQEDGKDAAPPPSPFRTPRPTQGARRPAGLFHPAVPDTMEEVREALYTIDAPELPALKMRVAAYAFNLAVLALWLPLGAALMAHSAIRGEDPAMAARAFSITSLGVALSQVAGV